MTDPSDANVFISYSSRDQTFAKKLKKRLQKTLQPLNTNVWMSDMIRRGAFWRREIDTALDSATLLILVISPASMKSAYVTYEWSYSLFRNHIEPYPIYFKECDRSTGMFGRLDDFQIPMGDCLYGDPKSKMLAPRFEEITNLIRSLPRLKAASDRLNDFERKFNENQRADAALELGRADRYVKPTAYQYLITGLEGQISGAGRNGVVAENIANALATLGDQRAVPYLYQLLETVGDYEPAIASVTAAIRALSSRNQ